MTHTDPLLLRKDGAIATLMINRPEKRNPIGFAMWKALPGPVERVESDPEIEVRSAKRIVQEIQGGQLEDDEETLRLHNDSFDGDDSKEGVRAFLDKRPPNFG